MKRLFASVTIAVSLAACAGGDAADTTTTSDFSDTTTSQSIETTTTTTIPPETTTTTAPPTTTTTEGDPLAPEASGCTPGTDILPDGEWYGGVRAFDEQGISFDLACLFFGAAAEAAAAEDGEESPPPNNYYIRNDNEDVRMLTVPPDTPVAWYTSGDPNDEENGTFTGWIEWLSTQESYYGIFVTVEDGNVTEIAEWWTP
jgi:hypothetical protein